MENQNNIEELKKKFTHIKGWAHDADPENEPTYPMKNYTGDDHQRLSWERPTLQKKTVEILRSTEHPRTPAIFGTTMPPSGLSGVLRRMAFKYSENKLRHWLILLMADRVDAIEGLVSDVGHARIPRMAKERGFKSLWQHNKQLMIRRTAFRATIYGAVIGLVVYNLMKDKDKTPERKRALETY